jgi:hypothetical protein
VTAVARPAEAAVAEAAVAAAPTNTLTQGYFPWTEGAYPFWTVDRRGVPLLDRGPKGSTPFGADNILGKGLVRQKFPHVVESLSGG